MSYGDENNTLDLDIPLQQILHYKKITTHKLTSLGKGKGYLLLRPPKFFVIYTTEPCNISWRG